MEKKNILVICESFIQGGAERHVLNQYQGLKNKCNFVFAFANYKPNNNLKDAKIYSINLGKSINNFIETTDQIIDIVKKEKIELIHLHPFNTIFPAMFASQITSTPIVYTVHGYRSLNFSNDYNTDILFRTFLNYCKPSVITVDKNYIDVLQYKYLVQNISYIPNSIDTKLFKNNKCVKNNKWLIISRLDYDKKREITEVFKNLNEMEIALDIIGDGVCRNELEQLAIELKIKDKVNFKGFKEDISKEIKDYNGVMGLGQVVLEGLASNLPVLLIGYGKITGLIDENLFEKIRNNNFVNRFITSNFNLEEFKQINNHLDKYQLSEVVKKYFDNEIVNNQYFQLLKQCEIYKVDQIINIYNDLKKLDYQALAEEFYKSKIVFNILKNNLINFITDPDIIDIFRVNTELEKMIKIENNMYRIEHKVDNIGLREVSKRTKNNFLKQIKKITNNFKRRW